MKFKMVIGCALMVCIAHTASAGTINWVDWQKATSGDPDVVTGSMGGIEVTYKGDYKFVQLGTGTNYWTEPDDSNRPYTGNAAIDNAPTASEMIALKDIGWHTITFAEAVFNPVMAIASMGQDLKGKDPIPVTYQFKIPFTLLSDGVGYWSYSYENYNNDKDGSYKISGNNLTGTELHAAIQFSGWVNSIAWYTTTAEDWHGVTVGAAPVPEPGTLLLFGTGIVALAGIRFRRKK